MYVLCSDPEWQADAAWYGIPVAQLAWESILMPENWGIMAPSMLMGMVIGVLGVVCVKQKVLAYTDPERAAQMAAHTAQNGWLPPPRRRRRRTPRRALPCRRASPCGIRSGSG